MQYEGEKDIRTIVDFGGSKLDNVGEDDEEIELAPVPSATAKANASGRQELATDEVRVYKRYFALGLRFSRPA